MGCPDYALGTTFDLKFTTRRFATGVPFTLAGGAVAAYPDSSLVEITAGLTLTADFDARTGLNNITVVATAANGFAAGSAYALVLTAGTVDGVSVAGEVVGSFTIEKQSALRPAVDGREAAIDASGRVDVGAMAANVVTAAAIADGAIDRATFAPDTGLQTLRSGPAQGGAAGSITLDAGASASDSFYNDTLVYLTGGTGAGQVRRVVTYTGATKVATVTPSWITAPDATTTFALLPGAQEDVGLWLGAAPSALVTGRVDASVGAIAAGVDFNATMKSSIKTQVVDALANDTYPEPGQIIPPATASIERKTAFLYKAWRNRTRQSATQYSLFGDDALTVDQKATFADDGTTADRGEVTTGP